MLFAKAQNLFSIIIFLLFDFEFGSPFLQFLPSIFDYSNDLLLSPVILCTI